MTRKLVVLSLCVLMTLASGCWDVRVVDDLALAFAMGVDAVEENPELISITMTNPTFSPAAEDTTAKTTVQGYNLSNVFVNAQRQRDRVLVLGQVSSIVFSEEVARNGRMDQLMKDVDQQRDMNPNTAIVIVRGSDAQEVIHLEPPEETRVAVYLANLLERNNQWGLLPEVTAADYWIKNDTSGVNPVVPIIEITGHEDDKKGILIVGLAAIDSQGKMVGTIKDSEIIHYLLLNREPRRSRFSTKVDVEDQKNRPATMYVKNVKRGVKAQIVNDKPEISITLEVHLDIIDVEVNIDTLEEDIFSVLESQLAKDIQRNALAMLSRTQDWKSDIVGLGRFVRVSHPQWFMGRDWDEDYKNAKISLDVKVEIKRIGTLINPLK